jgi:hypothetical protein
MVRILDAPRRGLVAGLVLLLLPAPGAWAGFVTTEQLWGETGFRRGSVDYSPDPGRAALPAAPTALTDPISGTTGVFSRDDPLSGSLYVSPRSDSSGNIRKELVGLFGTLPAASTLSASALIDRAVKATGSDSKGRPLDSLIDREPMKGPLVGRYRAAGVFVAVSGLEEGNWIGGYRDAQAMQQLMDLENLSPGAALAAAESKAAPVPGTLWTLALGLPWLLRRRRTG